MSDLREQFEKKHCADCSSYYNKSLESSGKECKKNDIDCIFEFFETKLKSDRKKTLEVIKQKIKEWCLPDDGLCDKYNCETEECESKYICQEVGELFNLKKALQKAWEEK